jgi:hypothetical protein
MGRRDQGRHRPSATRTRGQSTRASSPRWPDRSAPGHVHPALRGAASAGAPDCHCVRCRGQCGARSPERRHAHGCRVSRAGRVRRALLAHVSGSGVRLQRRPARSLCSRRNLPEVPLTQDHGEPDNFERSVPVLKLQPLDACKLAGVVRDQHEAVSQRRSGKQVFERPDRATLLL